MRSPNYPQEISTPIPFLRITCILTQLTHTIHEREESNQQRREKTHKTRQDTQEDKRHPRSPQQPTLLLPQLQTTSDANARHYPPHLMTAPNFHQVYELLWCACCPWLGLLLAALQYAVYFRFVDDVMFDQGVNSLAHGWRLSLWRPLFLVQQWYGWPGVACGNFQGCRRYGDPHRYGYDLPSHRPMGIFKQPEMTRWTWDKRCMFEFCRISTICYFIVSLYFCIILTEWI